MNDRTKLFIKADLNWVQYELIRFILCFNSVAKPAAIEMLNMAIENDVKVYTRRINYNGTLTLTADIEALFNKEFGNLDEKSRNIIYNIFLGDWETVKYLLEN